MRWHLSTDVDAFIAAAWGWLCRDPVANTIMLSAVAEYRAGQRWPSSVPPLFGWLGRDVHAAMCWFPPYEFALSAMTVAEAAELADAPDLGEISGVRGPLAPVEAFAARWAERSGTTPEAGRRQRLYSMPRPGTPPLPPPGGGRAARRGEIGVVVEWLHRFAAEAGSVAVDRAPWVRSAVASRLIWLWFDQDEPVAVACRHAPVESVSRVGPVYTPPELRRRGYGSAVTAAISAEALAVGADQVVLFADLANPTANRIYSGIGYRAVHDIKTVHFRPPARTADT